LFNGAKPDHDDPVHAGNLPDEYNEKP